MNVRWRGLFGILFLTLCLTGFLFQLQQLSQGYFKYSTLTRLEINVGDSERYAEIYFCSRYIDIIDRSNYQKYGHNPSAPREADQIANEISNISIKNIFKLTPSVDSVISSCVLRSEDLEIPYGYPKELCQNFINVSKSVRGEQVCYAFSVRNRKEYLMSSVASSLSYIGYVYEIELTEKLSCTRDLIFIMQTTSTMSGDKRHPYNSRIFPGKISNLDTVRKSRIFLYPETMRIHRLPPPFDTDCRDAFDSEWCYENCLMKQLKQINRVSWSAIIEEEFHFKMLSIKDMMNETISNFTKSTFTTCNKICRKKLDCETDLTKTRVVESNDAIHNLTRIAAMAPSSGAVNIRSIQQLPLMDYLVQIGSCLGTWFGLSIFSINPIKLKWSRLFGTDGSSLQRSFILQPTKCFCSLCTRRYFNTRL